MAKRITSLAVGEEIRLRFNGKASLGNETYELDATFLGLEGTGDESRASFALDGDAESAFEAYRYQGYWAYGTSAERLQLV